MIKSLLREITSSIAIKVLASYRHLSIQLFKIEAAKSYLRGVQIARLSVIGLILAQLMVGLVCLGVLLFHAGLFILLPWTLKAKALLGTGLGLAYAICGCAVFIAVLNEKTWMEKSGAVKMLNEVTCIKKIK